jgi:hypothetical protein
MSPNQDPKTILTLSAVPDLPRQVDRTPAASDRTRLCPTCGRAQLAIGAGAWVHVTQPVETETERRMAWGDR